MRTLGVATQTAINEDITTPVFLIELGFDTPIRFSNSGDVTFNSNTFTEASFKIDFRGDQTTITIFNESTQVGQIALTEGTAGRYVKVWQFYDLTEVELMLDGQMGGASIGDSLVIACKPRPPNRTPRDYVSEPVFNHLLKRGTKIKTKTQTIVIE